MKLREMSLKKCIQAIVRLLVAVQLAVLFVAVPARAQQETRLYLEPVPAQAGVMIFNIMVENVTDLYGAEFRLTYDPAILQIQDLVAGQEGVQIGVGTLLPNDRLYVIANQVDEVNGKITFAATLRQPTPAVNGTGPLARLAFTVRQSAPASIDFVAAKLISADLQTIPSQTAALVVVPETSALAGDRALPTVNTISRPVPMPASEASAFPVTFPWWIVAGAIIVLGSLALGALIIAGKPALSAAPLAAEIPALRRNHPKEFPHTRPSAFKQQTFPPDTPQEPQ